MRISGDVETIRQGTADQLAMVCTSLSQLVIGLAMGFARNWRVCLALIAAIPITSFAAYFGNKKTVEYAELAQKAYTRSGGIANGGIRSIRTLATLNGQQTIMGRYVQSLGAARNMAVKQGLYYGINFSQMNAIFFTSYSAGFYMGALSVKERE